MRHRFVRHTAFFMALFIIMGLCLADAGAQRRRRRSRRVAKPVIANPTIAPQGAEQNSATGEDKIISTADENSAGSMQSAEDADTRKAAGKRRPGQDDMQDTITTLSNQVTKLTDKLSQMQEEQRTLLDMERLTRAEQRAETLRAQLIDVQAKQADLQSKLEQIEDGLRPENIDRAVAMYGTTHPEEARDSRRRQLENERTRTRDQLNQLEVSRTRLEQAIATADAEVDLLRQRLEKGNPASVQAEGAKTTTDSTVPPAEPPPAKNPYP